MSRNRRGSRGGSKVNTNQKGGGGGVVDSAIGSLRTMASLMSRAKLAEVLNMRFGDQRKYYDIFGYKADLTYKDFLAKYARQDIASRIVDAPPSATWSNRPTFTNAAVQKEWEELDKVHNLWTMLQRADRLARLGAYSLVLFGFDRGKLANPIAGNSQLTFVRPLGMNHVEEIIYETDQNKASFGKPLKYRIKQELTTSSTASGADTKEPQVIEVHKSKAIHIVENAIEDDVFGIPIMEKIFNLLDDLLKVTGGTSEAFWIAANRGLHIDIDKEMDLTPEDAAELSDEVDEYIHGLRRVIRTRGVDVKNLGADQSSPDSAFQMIIGLLAGTTGIPKRILMGSEAGQLASEQDRANWAERITERRVLYAEPNILRPTLDLLVTAGALSTADTEIEWPSAFIMSPLESSQVMAQKARGIGNIARQTKVPMQITSREEAREIFGLEGDLPDSELLDDLNSDAPTGDVPSSSDNKPSDTNNGSTSGDNEEAAETS